MPPDQSPLRRVEVSVRVRPCSSTPREATCVALDERHHTITVADTSGMSAAAVRSHEYKQDVIFSDRTRNRDVFERLVLDKMRRATEDTPDTLCFLAYGHTSSGKTHTIAGSDEEPGVLTLCVEELLRRDGQVEVTMLEVYMDNVHDLLSQGVPRRVRHRPAPGGPSIIVEDLTTCSLVSLAQWRAVSTYGMRSRRTAATDRNARSSRSHAIFTVKSRGVRLCLVDLAGSERQTVFSPQLNKESIAINKSLSRLSTVLEALSTQHVREDGTRSYVNFRDTTLTVLLQRYLSGASLTTFLACVHPAAANFQETLSTLRYTHRLKRIRTSIVRRGGPGDVSAMMAMSAGTAEHQALLDELALLRARVQDGDRSTRLVAESQRLRIDELEAELRRQQQRQRPWPLEDRDRVGGAAGTRERALRAKDTKRVAGWLLSRVLGDLPLINVGYDDYFDDFFPPAVQVVGYVSTMACLPPLEAADGSRGLAFLDVGDLAMGLSMVDAGIPPMVRLHGAGCAHPEAWEGQEWDGEGNLAYVLAFFATGDGAVEAAGESASALPCCGGFLSCEPLLPIATVLCVPSAAPAVVKEAVLQRLVALQGEQADAFEQRSGRSLSVTSFADSMDGSLRQEVLAMAAERGAKDTDHRHGHDHHSGEEDNSASVSSGGAALAREMYRQSHDASVLNTPFKDASTSTTTMMTASSSARSPSAGCDPLPSQAEQKTAACSIPTEAPPMGRGDTTAVVRPDEIALVERPTAAGATAVEPAVGNVPMRKGRQQKGKGRPKTRGEKEGDKAVKFQACQECAVA